MPLFLLVDCEYKKNAVNPRKPPPPCRNKSGLHIRSWLSQDFFITHNKYLIHSRFRYVRTNFTYNDPGRFTIEHTFPHTQLILNTEKFGLLLQNFNPTKFTLIVQVLNVTC